MVLPQRLHAAGRPSMALLCGLLVFSPLFDGGTTHLAVLGIRLIVLALLGVCLWKSLQSGTFAFPQTGIRWSVLIFLGIAALSTVFSAYTHQSFQWLIVLVSYAALLFLLVSFVRGWNDIAALLAVFVGMGLFEAGLALYQGWWLHHTRPSGTFFNPNALAVYLVALWALLLGVLSHARLRGSGWRRIGTRRSWLTALGTVAAAVCLLGIMQTGSRGGAVALLAGTVVVLVLRFRSRAISALAFAVIAIVLLPSPLRDRLQAEHKNPVAYARWQVWQSSVRQMIDFPFGVGLGLYQYVSPRYAFPVEGQIARYGQVARSAHNEYLQMGVELGLAAPVVFVWGLVLVARQASGLLTRRLKRWERGMVVGMMGGATGLLVHAGLDSTFHTPALAILLVVFVGMLLAAQHFRRREEDSQRTTRVRVPRLLSATSILAVGLVGLLVVRMGLAWVSYDRGVRAAETPDLTRAIAHYQNAIELDARKALYHSSLAAAYFQVFQKTSDREAAKASLVALRSAISLNPIDGRLYGVLGYVYLSFADSLEPSEGSRALRESLLRAALATYQRAAELEPYSPFHRLAQGRIHLALGSPEEAEASVRSALQLEPNFLAGRAWLAKFYLDKGDPRAWTLATHQYREIADRDKRYAAWPKGHYEQRLLRVDTRELERRLG